MKIAHVILTHTSPEQLDRLVRKLQYEDAHFYIHVDLKQDIVPYKALLNSADVRFVENRMKVYWGGYSIVQATINSFTELFNSGVQYDYINCLSGHDYPIKSTAYIHQYLKDNPRKVFMHSLSIEQEWTEALPRIRKYHLVNYNFPGKYKVEKLINILLPERKFPASLEPVGRSQWFTIPPECAKYVVDYLEKNKDVRNFFKLTWAPDEMIFQTILYQSQYRKDMVNNNLLYVDWSEGKPHPKVLRMEDADRIKNSAKLFARKFDIKVDSGILDYIDSITQ